MDIKRRRFIAAFINTLLLLLAFLLRYSGATLSIGNATPVLLLPITVSVSIFFGGNASLLSGIFAGVLMDSAAADTSCFNTVFFVLAATAGSMLSSRFLNRNLKAAVCLSVGVSFAYFFIKYLVFFAFRGVAVNYDYFILYLIPSVVYTAVWIIPFYFLQKKLSEI